MKRVLLLMVALCCCSGAFAAERSTYAARTAAKLDSGLVIVPFAIPVAVPVATVRQPSVLYSYRGYAAGYVPANTPTASPRASEPVADATALLARHCGSCHRGAAAEGQMQLFDDSGLLLAKLPRRRILEAVESGRMPQPLTAPRLTAAELEAIRRWAEPPRELVY